jgi:head-tail adaptor
MTASDLNEWIALFQMELTPDGQGGFTEVIPANLTPDVPASVREMSSSETHTSDQIASRVRYEITIRHEPGYSSDYRVMWRDLYLDIVARPENVKDTWLKLICGQKESGAQ